MRFAVSRLRRTCLAFVFAVPWAFALQAYAQDGAPNEPVADAASAQPAEPAGKDYVLPAMEIIGFDFLLNRANRCCGTGRDDYAVSRDSIRRNLRSSWGVDADPFLTNQLGHPYQGSMYHGFARSAGLSYWEAAGYTFAGSAMWEVFGEQTPPSRNDQVSSGIGGSFLGEALYRMSSLLLEKGGGMSPFWRETAAAVISPANGFNRLVMGRRLDSVFASRNPAYYSQVQVGYMGTARSAPGTSTVVKRNELQADFSLDYGMPGKDGYQYTRPFDYFSFHTTVSSAGTFESVLTRGLLVGRDYRAGKDYRGIWGLYGSYDFISPQTFRVSSTALSLGTTGQWRASENVAVQGTVMGGLGYAAVGTINGASENAYRYGVAPQALASLRVIFGGKSSLDITGREYYVSRVAGIGQGGHDNISRADVSYTWRVRDQHAFTLKYLWNRRHATFATLGDRTQSRGTIGIFYTLLGYEHFGKVDWK
ncbi:DUF3943 domain-containing protein [Ramlibacter sp. WS9]|uniref:DUF3943 domain-containing protein n=1 Tax=Ramlibacter sp. WS9 TaxID=1882741 RepID=UPI0011440E2D|nr:DUF3943 domain-containing protein [Ramlibacter sp. WS9]ROZ78272.1 DUF3943 domain-containing protein [Ramlibacter sp. WS9]